MSNAALLAAMATIIAFNALFVAAEFAVVAAPRASIERRAQDGSLLAQMALRLLRSPLLRRGYIATTQVAISAASLLLGMVGESEMSEWLAPYLESTGLGRWVSPAVVASVLIISVLTYLQIVLGEMLPKTLALIAPERALLGLLPMVMLGFVLTAPLVIALQWLGALALRLLGLGGRDDASQGYHTAEEIEQVVAESATAGLLEDTSGRILREIFDFGDLNAGEVMTPRTQIVGLELGVGGEDLRATVQADPFTRYPVYEGDLDRIVGVVNIKQLLGPLRDGSELRADVLGEVPHLPATASLDTVLDAMHRTESKLAVIMDEFGGTAGIITTDDLSAEVVGAIAAGKPEDNEIRHQAPGELYVLGTARLDELAETLDRGLEHEDVDTVSGLVLMLLNRPPQVGDRVEHAGLAFEVIEVLGLGVGACLVSALDPGDEGAGVS